VSLALKSGGCDATVEAADLSLLLLHFFVTFQAFRSDPKL